MNVPINIPGKESRDGSGDPVMDMKSLSKAFGSGSASTSIHRSDSTEKGKSLILVRVC